MLVPKLRALKNPPPGEVQFPIDRPVLRLASPSTSAGGTGTYRLFDWMDDKCERVLTWDKNPWKSKRSSFGDHYFELCESRDPLDVSRIRRIQRMADVLHQKVLMRYPELEVPEKWVPAERNGFLKVLELIERYEANPKHRERIRFPEDIKKHLIGKAPWNAVTVRDWLSGEQPLMGELRQIGRMSEQSNAGIDINDWAYISAGMCMDCTDALLLEARLAAEDRDAVRAMQSVQAANGLARHLGDVETPTLIQASLQILIRRKVQNMSYQRSCLHCLSGSAMPLLGKTCYNRWSLNHLISRGH